MRGHLLLSIPAGIGCLFPKFILASHWYRIPSPHFIGLFKNFHTSLIRLLGSKRVILLLAFKNQISCCDIYHLSHSLKKSNNCPETITSFSVLSWNPAVLWGFWNNQNQRFFHSDFFHIPRTVVVWFWFLQIPRTGSLSLNFSTT